MTVGLHKERRNLKEFFDALLMSFKEQFEQKKILSLLDIKNEGLSLYFDNDRLQTAIGNILDNAVKFNPEKTRIEIKAKQEKNFVEISIKDNGVGIPKQYLKHVFETFTQQDSDFTGQIKGMGLGLYLTHEVIKAHRGEITCNSQLGKGTEFLIKLPVV